MPSPDIREAESCLLRILLVADKHSGAISDWLERLISPADECHGEIKSVWFLMGATIRCDDMREAAMQAAETYDPVIEGMSQLHARGRSRYERK